MAAYQSQATGVSIEPAPGMALPDALSDLLPADLYVSLNAHPGRPEVLTAWLDPSVVDESDPLSVDPDLDMFNSENGPPYDSGFVSRYRDAQRERNHRITAWARQELDRLAGAGAWDRVFNIHRVWADLRFTDLSIDPSDRGVGSYAGDARWANYGPLGIGRTSTLRSWLSMWSLDESQCRGEPHLRRVEVPSLVVQSLADQGVYPSDARAIHEALATPTKRLDLVPGDHYLLAPDGARDQVADLIGEWVEDQVR